MTDRELLEAAARAAGVHAEWHNDDDADFDTAHEGMFLKGERGPDNSKYWNPLTNDGDALRLAVKLRMCVESWGSGAAAVVTVNNRALVAEPHYGDDPARATRRAIVRAAAAMAASK